MAQGWLTDRRWEDEHSETLSGNRRGSAYYEKSRGKSSNAMHFEDDDEAAKKLSANMKGAM